MVSLFAILVVVVILASLWTGILRIGQAGKSGAWWIMLVSISGLTLGIVAYCVVTWLFYMKASSGSSTPSDMMMMSILGLTVPLSILLFAIGFAMHGLKVSSGNERVKELEQLAGAMSEEIDRLREGGGV